MWESRAVKTPFTDNKEKGSPMKVRRWSSLFLVIVVAAALLSLAANQGEQAALGQQAGPTTAASTANAMAVDAVAGGAIDPTRTVTGTAPFEIDIVITSAPTPYYGYGYTLGWDPAVLDADTAVKLEPADFPSCPKPVLGRSNVWGSCAQSEAGTQFVGAVTMVRFHCVTDGVSPLHLVTAAEMPLEHTATTGRDGGQMDTALTDASVTCQNVGPPAPAPAPAANDDFANAKAVPGLPFSASLNTAGATREQGELGLCGMGGATVWYSFTPDTTQFIQADTLGSDFDTVLSVYTGASLASLTPVGCNDDTADLQSAVTTKLDGGQTYYFQVGGLYGHRGSLVFHLEAVPPPPSPTSNAIVVDATSGGGIGSTRTVIGTAPFDIDIHITDASQPYQGYQYMLQWDPAVLAYDGQENLYPAGLSLCARAMLEDGTVRTGCTRANGTTQFVGPVNTVTLHCVADGTTRLHLRTHAEEPYFYAVTLGYAGVEMDTILTDASITCRGAGEAAPSAGPTPVPVPPVTGTGGFLEGP